MDIQKKCSLEEHKNIDAIIYCPGCRLYMCNKCENYHLALFKRHNPLKLGQEEDLFTGYCKQKNHYELKYFCKTHNELCCAACLCKINEGEDGQHKDCDVCLISKIIDEKKNKLIENIKSLENLEKKFNESIEKLKEIFQKIEKDKEGLKLEIQNIFTKLRNAINEREEELLLEVDNLFNKKFITDDLITKGKKLPKQIKSSLEKGKSINKEWNNNNINLYIYHCINIENNLNTIKEINKNINKYKNNEVINIKFGPKENKFNNFIEKIKNFGNIYINDYYSFKKCPNNLDEKRKYKISGENNNIITKTGSNGYMGAICENELDNSIEEYRWKIKLLQKAQTQDFMVGVAPKDFDINTSTYKSCGWYCYCYHEYSTLFSGPPHNYSNKNMGLKIANGEIIIVMNMKKRTLKFIINNEDKGDAYTNIPIDKPLFPAVFLFYQNDSIEITQC